MTERTTPQSLQKPSICQPSPFTFFSPHVNRYQANIHYSRPLRGLGCPAQKASGRDKTAASTSTTFPFSHRVKRGSFFPFPINANCDEEEKQFALANKSSLSFTLQPWRRRRLLRYEHSTLVLPISLHIKFPDKRYREKMAGLSSRRNNTTG